jgi:hypothetical protein
MGIIRITHFVEIPKDDKKISGKLLCQNYLWHYLLNPKACLCVESGAGGGVWGAGRLRSVRDERTY